MGAKVNLNFIVQSYIKNISHPSKIHRQKKLLTNRDTLSKKKIIYLNNLSL